MNEQPTLDAFRDDTTPTDQARPEATEAGKIVFRLSADQFVNEAIAELARLLQSVESIQVDVSPDTVQLPPEQEIEPVLDMIEGAFEEALSRTHSRTAPARQINTALKSMGASQQDERWVPPAEQHFPGRVDQGLTIYDGDRVDAETLSAVGIEPKKVPAVENSDRGLYALNPEFVGNSSSKHFPESQVPRFRRYFDAFADTLRGTHDPDDSVCMNCGARSMPAYKDSDDEILEYNQTFTVFASASGRATALGYGARDSAHRGRCAACLIAGFYYALMEKVVRPTGTSENDVRVFSPIGNLTALVRIRSDLQAIYNSADPPTTEEYRGRQTIGDLFTDSHGMQVIEFYERILQHLNTTIEEQGLFERELRHRPTALTTYISEVGQTRTIRAMETIDPDMWAYDAVRQRSLNDGHDQYWPVADVLSWFAHLTVEDENKHIVIQDDLAFGILDQTLPRIERAVFAITKLINRSEAAARYVPHPGYRTDYFEYVMTESTTLPDSIDDESMDSIRKVATSLGRVFHGQDDIGVLIKLQNASTPSTFLQAFEKAAMQAQKRSHDESPSQWEASRDDDVSRVLKLIGNRETFDAAKRMFVIHASLAAQYENVRQETHDNTTEAE